tara:strand:+ start:564 stop:923 length:360 start_codon:yes stop_codon:yes gene_type:complete
MKQILTAAMLLFSLNAISQDTTAIMITLQEVLYMDYNNGLEITDVQVLDGTPIQINIAGNEQLILHLYDNLAGMHRKITTRWLDDNDVRSKWHQSTDNVLHAPYGYGPMVVNVSYPVLK